MSLFIGTDVNSKKILHITNGTHGLATMKAGVMSSTVFHNDMQFYSYEIVNITSFEYVYSSGGGAPSPVKIQSGGGYVSPNCFLIAHCDTSKIALHTIGTDSSFHLLSSSNTTIGASSNFGFTNPNARIPSSWGGVSYPDANTYITGSHTLPCFGGIKTRGSSSFPSISSLGIASILIIYKPPNQTLGNGVKISKNSIQIGNKNLRNFKYVYNGTVNNHPQCLQITPYIQLVDTSKISGNLEIVSNPGYTAISVGGHNVIATDTNYYDTSGGTAVSVTTSSVYWPPRYTNIAPLSGSMLYVIVYQAGAVKFKGYISNYANFATFVYQGPSPYNVNVTLKTNGSHLLLESFTGSLYSSDTQYTNFEVYYKYF